MQKSFFSIMLLTASLSACSWSIKHNNNETPTLVESATKEDSSDKATEQKAAAATQAVKEDSKDRELASKISAASESNSQVSPAPKAPTPSHEEVKGVDPEKALGWLRNGNTRFKKNRLRKDGQSFADIKRLSSGQTPHTIVLSCSDSRVPPEIVFDQKLGEIFVVRNAGEIPDEASIASMEYAVEHLGTRLIVVMGHTSCGAVKAAIATMGGADAGSPALNALVKDIHPRIATFKNSEHAADVHAESWANAKGIANDILDRSAIIREKVSQGKIKIKAALYDLANGNVEFDNH